MKAIQLDIFSWHNVKISEGFEHLSRFDFTKAVASFEDVLSKIPDHPKAIKAKEVMEDWMKNIQRAGSLSKEESVRLLWENFKGYRFPKEHGYRLFKKAILNKLISLMDDNYFYIHPDLCRGYLYLLDRRYQKAEESIRILLKKYTYNSRLIGYLADSIWCQGRKYEARNIYARALLISPSNISLKEIKDEKLRDVAEDDIEMSAINGWLAGILPLINITDNPSIDEYGCKGLNIYRLLYDAEKARFSNNYDKMISCRMMIKRESIDIFNKYMKKINPDMNLAPL